MESPKSKRVISLISITSDIGFELARRYSKKGNTVVGTYRSTNRLDDLEKIPNCSLFYCDVDDRKSVNKFAKAYSKLNLNWDTFISCVGNPLPLKPFFGNNFGDWNKSVYTNVIGQLHVLHELYPFRDKNKISNVVYLAGGGGANAAVANFSAYNSSKIMLTKMCELINFENDDLNIFIVGPGWTKTKTHNLILKNVDLASEKYRITKDFMEHKEGTSMEDIFDCIEWLNEQGKDVAGGRNFSVVHDQWGDERLAKMLKSDINMYKLRRFGNNLKINQGENKNEII